MIKFTTMKHNLGETCRSEWRHVGVFKQPKPSVHVARSSDVWEFSNTNQMQIAIRRKSEWNQDLGWVWGCIWESWSEKGEERESTWGLIWCIAAGCEHDFPLELSREIVIMTYYLFLNSLFWMPEWSCFEWNQARNKAVQISKGCLEKAQHKCLCFSQSLAGYFPDGPRVWITAFLCSLKSFTVGKEWTSVRDSHIVTEVSAALPSFIPFPFSLLSVPRPVTLQNCTFWGLSCTTSSFLRQTVYHWTLQKVGGLAQLAHVIL